ncbi:sugar phosphate isomerase/epimerase [Algoriphagus halophytocola]|uniref:Sugar phosphate isomerase/epimerase n=1 Tax=Algoriphagus halophytocola TaxID=2991499 RepID=A0ABY6MFT6_9BACT|nr:MULTISPECIES: sugar phosphate isomerase/epimerase [unclassified Algoriphagus]UZD22652.1 sugar phosphate isomerase/epimerase [Algoriphagus sp. TR-M5]WBL43917.1 sugar phosphate isomerase/epimerase [Algoriphagus sp. TR-M9]
MKRIFIYPILLLALFSPSIAAHAQEIALQLYSLRNEMKEDPVKSHQLIQNWGISALEGGGPYGMSDQEYSKLLEENQLRVIGVGADYKQLLQSLEPIISQAKKYGAKYATCYWIPHAESPISLDEIKVATALFNEVGKQLKKEGITFLYHPHGYEFAKDGKGVVLDYMLNNAEHFAFNLDVFWVKMGGGDPLKIMKKNRGKFPILHLKDRKKGTPGSKDGRADIETNVVLGTGDINIAGIIKEAKKQGTEFLTIEDESSRSVTQIPLSVAFIQKELNR